MHPEVVAPLRVNGAVVDERALRAIIVFVFLYLGVCAAGAVVILVDSSLRGVELTAFQALAARASAARRRRAGPRLRGPDGVLRSRSATCRRSS